MTPQFLAEKTWDLYQTFGVPIEVSEDIIDAKGLKMDKNLLQELIENHQKKSQSVIAPQFKSGVGEDSGDGKTVKLHTLTHILHAALREIFGSSVKQIGSAITNEKARFDVSLDGNLITNEKIVEISKVVQNIIDKNLEMVKLETTPENAKNLGAIGLFGEKYGEKVTIYTLSEKINDFETVYSREFCGGPHIQNTSEIGTFVFLKKKSIGNGQTRLEFDVN